MIVNVSKYHLIIYFIVYLLEFALTAPSQSNYNISEYPGIKYCFSSMDLLDGSMSSNYFILKRELDKNCTHVNGNILINGLVREADGSEPDLRFLSSIIEITGSLKIKNTNVSIIPLTKLAVIRGDSKLHRLDIIADLQNSLDITWDYETHTPIRTIFDLRNLRSIVSGHIQLSPVICGQLVHVNWDELLEEPKQQNVKGECVKDGFQCSSKCPIRKDKRYCWGSSDLQCQKFSKCEKRMCANRCYISSNGEEECCNSQCLGGCTSSTADSCIACAGVLDNGKCQRECPPKKIYNRETGSYVDNKDFKPSFVKICVKKCPDNLLEQEGECKSQCTIKNYEKRGDKCVPCLRYCEHICTMEEIFDKHRISDSMISLDSKKIKKLANCTTFKGSILIDKESFVRFTHLPDYEPIIDPSDLWNLNNLRNISGSIYIDLKHASFSLDNVSFLSNLQIIEGNLHDVPVSLGIYNTNIKFLGLRNLVSIGLKGHTTRPVALINHSSLCYFDTDMFKKALNFDAPIKLFNLANKTKCVAEGKICSSQCDSTFGCWGPGPGQCHNCAKKKLGTVCGDNCTSVPGYFQNVINEKICLKCNDECALTCSGQGADQCIGGCKHAKQGINCVAVCSRTHFLNNKTAICQKCNSECHQRDLTLLSVCTGPSFSPGPGGCNKCQTLILDRKQNLQRCTNNPVDYDYFSENLPNTNLSPFSQFTEKFTDLIVTYQPCNTLCSKCTFATAQRIKDHYTSQVMKGCLHCKGYWYLEECVAKCPPNITYLLNDPRNTSKGECLSCHPQCQGCVRKGNDNCIKCNRYLLHDKINKSKFLCVDSCPVNYKEKIFDSKLNQTICHNVLLSKLELSMVVIAALFVLILMIFAFVIAKICYTRNEKRRKNKLKAFFSNANEEDSSKFIEPNMNKVPCINVKDLDYDKINGILGKGAFGTVYLGTWKPSDSDFDDNISINSCKDRKVEVAVKEVNESCSLDDFMDEVKIMASVRHRNCLRLIGVCFKGSSHLLISSYIPLGSMDKYLSNNKQRLTGLILLSWAEQIANGMLYLERNHIIHRDLATRNVLIFQENHVQITDFGLAKLIKSETIRISSGIVPVRWLAIESIRDGIYSHKTDVWAYAVTLWEIFNFAKTPYHPISAPEIRDEIIKGTRLCQPEICSLEIYILMLKCWSVDPNERPTFEYIWNEFKIFCENPKTYLSHPNYNESRANNNPNSNINYLQIVENRENPFKEMSKQSSQETIMMTPRRGGNMIYNSQSSLKIPRNIVTMLSDRPTKNPLYQPAEDFNTPLISNEGTNLDLRNSFGREHLNGFYRLRHDLALDQHTRNGSSPGHMTTEYMEPENLNHISNQNR